MKNNKPISLDVALQQNRERLNKVPPSLRPRREHRPNSSRNPEKAVALGRAVCYCLRKAEKEGYIVKVTEGYMMSWKFADTISEAVNNENPLKRHMNIAAIISNELEKRDVLPIIVGVSALEFYSVSNCLARNVEFNVANQDIVKEVMGELGFKCDRGTWYLDQNRDILVEFQKSSFDGSCDKIQKIIITNNTTLKMIGIEDLLLARAVGAREYGETNEWIKYIMVGNYDRIDWDYLNEKSQEFQCVDAINHSCEWAKTQRGKFEEEKWTF